MHDTNTQLRQTVVNHLEEVRQISGVDSDIQGVPLAVAIMLDLESNQGLDLNSFCIGSALAKYAGMRLERYVSGIKRLDETLQRLGVKQATDKIGNGGDNYIYSISHRCSRWEHVLVCETQTRFYIVLMRFHEQVVEGDCSPEIFICQRMWNENGPTCVEHYGSLPNNKLPRWQDDESPDGYVVHLSQGQDVGYIHHCDRANYCTYSLASFIEATDNFISRADV